MKAVIRSARPKFKVPSRHSVSRGVGGQHHEPEEWIQEVIDAGRGAGGWMLWAKMLKPVNRIDRLCGLTKLLLRPFIVF